MPPSVPLVAHFFLIATHYLLIVYGRRMPGMPGMPRVTGPVEIGDCPRRGRGLGKKTRPFKLVPFFNAAKRFTGPRLRKEYNQQVPHGERGFHPGTARHGAPVDTCFGPAISVVASRNMNCHRFFLG
jgi:hypothetical protein